MKTSILLPTWKRKEKYKLALESLTKQTLMPYEIVTIYRDVDPEAKEIIDQYIDKLPLKPIMVEEPGVVFAENTALKNATGDIVLFLDDDAEAPPHWVEKIVEHFKNDSKIGGVGGPDLITEHDDPNYRKIVSQVGIIKPYGKIIGNHHHMTDSTMEVDVLKGVNMAFRRDIIPYLDNHLQSTHSEGNGSHWELDVCIGVTKQGYKLIFDPALDVNHNSNHSHFIHHTNIKNNARNLTYVILKHFSALNRIYFLLYIWILGNTQIIGIGKFIQISLKEGPIKALGDFYYSTLGHLKGLLLYWKAK
jgi:glycosyltransferase involved in cell wall biosynthesis